MTDEMPLDPHGPNTRVAITPQQMMKRLVWDIVPCSVATQTAIKVGLSPASEDVEEMEHRSSHDRLRPIEPIGPMIQMMSGMAVRAALESTEVVHGEVASTDPESAMYLHGLVYQATVGILAELHDAGILELKATVA